MLKTLIQAAVATAATIVTVKTINGEIKWSFGFSKEEPVAKAGEEVPPRKGSHDPHWKKH